MYHKKLCILIISCEFYNSDMNNVSERWIYEKRCWEKYMNSHSQIDVYFLEYGEPKINGNTIFIPYDGYDGIYKKTIHGMKMLEKKYEFYLRTNLNTFVIFDKLITLLNRIKTDHNMELPFYGATLGEYKHKLLYNHKPFHFVSGACTLMNYKAIQTLVTNGFQDKYTTSNFPDDVIIGMFFHDLNITPNRYEIRYDWNFGTSFNRNIELLGLDDNKCCVRTVRSHATNARLIDPLINHFYQEKVPVKGTVE